MELKLPSIPYKVQIIKPERSESIRLHIIKKLIPYVFLALLIILALQSIAPLAIKLARIPLMVAAIVLGAVNLYLNRDILCRIDDEAQLEVEEEKKRQMEFPEKYPKVYRMWGIGLIARWMYKEGWLYSIGIIAIFLLSIAVYSYNLGKLEFWSDEYQVVGAAAGYYYNQNYHSWDWLNNISREKEYTRAFPHTWMIAQSYRFFGISEWSSRIVSVFFGILFIPLSYFISKFFTHNKNISILMTIVFLFYVRYIDMFRFTRMYALLTPIFLLLVYFGYRWITEKNNYIIINENITTFIRSNINFNYLYLIIFLIILVIGYFIHINVLVILPAIFLFIVYQAFLQKERKYVAAAILGFCVVIIIAFFMLFTDVLSNISYYISFFKMRNYHYLVLFTSYPFPYEVGIVILATCLPGIFFLNNNKPGLKNKVIYLFVFIVFSLPFFMFIANRFIHFMYISYLMFVYLLLIVTMYYWSLRFLTNKYVRSGLIIILFLFIGLSFYERFDGLYNEHKYFGQYSEAYQIIITNYNPEKEVILGQYLRTYYLRDLGPNIKIINMLNFQRYTFEQFMSDLEKFDSGWIVWETIKREHINEEIIEYVDMNFDKYHGNGIDDTNVEVYYFNKSMLK